MFVVSFKIFWPLESFNEITIFRKSDKVKFRLMVEFSTSLLPRHFLATKVFLVTLFVNFRINWC